MSHLELRQVACVLAAMVDPHISFGQLAWWRLNAVNHGPNRQAA